MINKFLKFFFLSTYNKASNVNSFVSGKYCTVNGTVVRVSNVRPLCIQMKFRCTFCKHEKVSFMEPL